LHSETEPTGESIGDLNWHRLSPSLHQATITTGPRRHDRASSDDDADAAAGPNRARYKDFKGEYRDIRATSDGRFQRPPLES
jgi:hypothetical protein